LTGLDWTTGATSLTADRRRLDLTGRSTLLRYVTLVLCFALLYFACWCLLWWVVVVVLFSLSSSGNSQLNRAATTTTELAGATATTRQDNIFCLVWLVLL
jgi:hypothetical protein